MIDAKNAEYKIYSPFLFLRKSKSAEIANRTLGIITKISSILPIGTVSYLKHLQSVENLNFLYSKLNLKG